jgi:hypothetical protein
MLTSIFKLEMAARGVFIILHRVKEKKWKSIVLKHISNDDINAKLCGGS